MAEPACSSFPLYSPKLEQSMTLVLKTDYSHKKKHSSKVEFDQLYPCQPSMDLLYKSHLKLPKIEKDKNAICNFSLQIYRGLYDLSINALRTL